MKDDLKKILLVMPPVVPANEMMSKNLASYKEIPYGILSIAAYLKQYYSKTVQVEILDLNVADKIQFKDILQEKMEQFKPQLVGISGLFSSMFNYVNEFSAYIKQYDPEVVLVVGGIVSTNCYEFLFKHNQFIDGACFSEGEIPMLKLLESDDPLELLKTHRSWITREKVNEGITPQPSFIQDLDEIPPLDYSLLELEKYDFRCRNNNPIVHNEKNAIRLPFITTRGCPFNCVFCAASSLSGKKVRFMSAERVIADIKRAKLQFNMTRLVINDDQALLDRERIKKILLGIEEMQLIVEFPSGLNVKFIDEETARLLKKAGLEIANLAVESGSENVLKEIINKPLRIPDIAPAVNALRKNGLLVHGFFIFGFPGEHEEDRQATVELIKRIGFDWANIYAAAPIRGSRLYQICVDNGYIKDDGDLLSTTIYGSLVKTSELEPDYISKYVYRVNLDVNFVNNYRMKIGDFEIAKGYFSNVAKNHPSHAFAHYFLAQTYEKLRSDKEVVQYHRNVFFEIVNKEQEWAEYAAEFKLI